MTIFVILKFYQLKKLKYQSHHSQTFTILSFKSYYLFISNFNLIQTIQFFTHFHLKFTPSNPLKSIYPFKESIKEQLVTLTKDRGRTLKQNNETFNLS